MTTNEYLDIYSKYPFATKEHYDGQETDQEAIRQFNRDLCNKYPWLIPRNDFSGKRITDCAAGEKGFWPGNPDKLPEYNYEYTLLDDLPDGWRRAFGDQLCEELNEELVKFNFVDKYFITQIKEKFGTLRWYDNGIPVGKLSENYETIVSDDWKNFDHNKYHYVYIGKSDEETHAAIYKRYEILEKCKIYEIINKYEQISGEVCIDCGKPAKWETTGWVTFICDDCKQYMESRGYNGKFIPINED